MDKLTTCSVCGAEIAKSAKVCPKCGAENKKTAHQKKDKGPKKCKTCGAEVSADDKICPQCGASLKKPIYKRVWFWVVIVLILLIAIVASGGEDEPATDDTTNSQVEQQDTTTEEPAEEPAEEPEEDTEETAEAAAPAEFNPDDYHTYKYNNLARDPDKYLYELVTSKGKVVQVIEGDEEVQLRVAIGGDYDKIMFLEYEKEITSKRILEDDIIRYYGISMGTITYQSTLGGNITIPATYVTKIEILEEAQ